MKVLYFCNKENNNAQACQSYGIARSTVRRLMKYRHIIGFQYARRSHIISSHRRLIYGKVKANQNVRFVRAQSYTVSLSLIQAQDNIITDKQYMGISKCHVVRFIYCAQINIQSLKLYQRQNNNQDNYTNCVSYYHVPKLLIKWVLDTWHPLIDCKHDLQCNSTM